MAPEQINTIPIERYWLVTWTTYGSWLPGDDRGHVGTAPDETGRQINHNQPGTPYCRPDQLRRQSAARRLKSAPVLLHVAQAKAMLEQFQETTCYRQWLLVAAAIMHTHLHLVVGVSQDPEPDKILGDLKSYGSRRLNRGWGKPGSDTWWTTGGSTRKLPDEQAAEAAVDYVRRQPNPLVVWTREQGLVFVKGESPDRA